MRLLAIFCAGLALWQLTLNAMAEEVHVAVASNFLEPVKALKKMFEQETSHKVKLSAGSTGKLYAQINHGAPFEVFLAADKKRPELLITKDTLAVPDSLFTYALGQLTLWSIQPELVDDQGEVLKHRRFNHIAMASPRTAPYGAASLQVLEHFHSLETYRGHLIKGTNVSQVFQYIATGNADLGFIAFSQYKTKGKALGGSYWLVDHSLYEPLEQGAVLLAQGTDNPAATAFLAMLKTEPALQMIEEFGYARPAAE